MDRNTAIDAATNAMGDQVASLVTDEDWEAALTRSVIPDAAGKWPAASGWVPTYDAQWLAAEAVEAVAARVMGSEVVTRWTSESTTMEVAPADLLGLADRLRAKSPMYHRETVLEVGGPVADYDTRAQTWPDASRRRIIGNWS